MIQLGHIPVIINGNPNNTVNSDPVQYVLLIVNGEIEDISDSCIAYTLYRTSGHILN